MNREEFINVAKSLEGADFEYDSTGEDGAFDCFGLVIASLSQAINADIEDYPNHLRYPTQVIQFFRASRTIPEVGDLLFVKNNDGVTHHTLIYMGGTDFVHSSSAPSDNGDQKGVVVEDLPQLLSGEYAVLSLGRYVDYIKSHFEGTNINTFE